MLFLSDINHPNKNMDLIQVIFQNVLRMSPGGGFPHVGAMQGTFNWESGDLGSGVWGRLQFGSTLTT